MSNSSTNSMSKINCTNCNSLQPKKSNFCMDCGSRLFSSTDKMDKPLMNASSNNSYQSSNKAGKSTINSSVLVSIKSKCSDFVCQSDAEFLCAKCRSPLCISHALRINKNPYCSKCGRDIPGEVTYYRRNMMGGYNVPLPLEDQCKYFCLIFGTFGCIILIVLIIVFALL